MNTKRSTRRWTKMSELFDNIPDISFIDNITPEELTEIMINSFTEKYEEVTGKPITLKSNDPTRLLLQALTLPIYQSLQKIDYAGKNNLLKYAEGDYLDNIAVFKGLKRAEATPSTVDVEFVLSEARAEIITIPAGTNVTTGNYDVYWETDIDTVIPAGETRTVVTMTCTEPGALSNGYEVGSINELVNTIPYIDTVNNITVSAGGEDIENDESLRERIYLAPSSYSSAGSKNAYIYHIKTFNSAITDVVVTTPVAEPGVVDVVYMKGSTIPTEEEIAELQNYLMSCDEKPLTDYVRVSAPSTQLINVDVRYFINADDKAKESEIKANIEKAIDEYIAYQTSKIGLRINPNLLTQMAMNAGASRIIINEPNSFPVSDKTIAVLGTKNVEYGGME